MTRGVVGQVADQPLEPSAVADHPPRRDAGAVDPKAGGRSESCGLLEHEVVEVHGEPAELQRPFVHPRQQQQILDDPLESYVLLQNGLRKLVHRRPIGMGQRDLRVLAYRGDG